VIEGADQRRIDGIIDEISCDAPRRLRFRLRRLWNI
jgi:hypothetical protein